ncbi:Zn(II)2Cys6 transcription factor domain-containing protein [Aspergillus lucknowensis]|uniref:Zn(2)-C6 fungal-type domain-containing protein n=1 Tax=Aspergillus lucknowensis TaxID=176173 RepID=A0ABR4LR36_9EURO
MVYTGKPSTGCQTCRSRRIKCDETRPHCNACIRSSRECPGYPHPLDVRIRPQRTLTWIAENPGRSVASSAKDDDVDMKESVQNSTTSPELSSIPSLPLRPETPTSLVPPQIPGGLYLPMEDTVTGLFFSSYVYAPRDPLVRTGSMELLPRLYAAAPVASPVRMGALAVAYFSVASWTRQEHLLRSARQCFVNTLALTREALQGDVEKSFDEVLMAMLLLYIYEEFDAIKENRLSDKAHLRGAIALINKYRPLNRDSCLSSTLTNAVQTEIVSAHIFSIYARPNRIDKCCCGRCLATPSDY